ncbi:MAG: hypothetical protein HUJ90_04255 [Bacteroidales bacterium]|nr:hypothetical protein [Bacteroidales bacterium]
METRFAHIYSKGERVIFRNEDDYVSFNNKLAAESYFTKVGIIGMAIMSTHFHCVVEYYSDDMLQNFKERIKKSYCIAYSRKYSGRIAEVFNISSAIIEDVYALKRTLVYVLKNPVHHKVTDFATRYEFSSASTFFMNELYPAEMIDLYMKNLVRIGDTIGRRRRKITIGQVLPDNWLVDEKDMILPLSYLKIGRARAVWNGYVSQFLYDMNASTRDAQQEIIPEDVLVLKSRSYDDMGVCRIIDTWAASLGKSSFHCLTDTEKQELASNLFRNGIPRDQVSRCLWL